MISYRVVQPQLSAFEKFCLSWRNSVSASLTEMCGTFKNQLSFLINNCRYSLGDKLHQIY